MENKFTDLILIYRERFSRQVQKNGVSECWPWLGQIDVNGYGRVRFNSIKEVKAHRMSYMVANSYELASEEFILHSCDNPPCCNPSHLRIGTQQDNIGDTVSRDRIKFGETHHASTFTEDTVRLARKMYSNGMLQKDIAAKLGVKTRAVSDVVRRKTWSRVL